MDIKLQNVAEGLTANGKYYTIPQLEGKTLADEPGGGVEDFITEKLGDAIDPKVAEDGLSAYLEAQKGKIDYWMEHVDGKTWMFNAGEWRYLSDIAFVPDSTYVCEDPNYGGGYVSYDNLFQGNTNLLAIGELGLVGFGGDTFRGCVNLTEIKRLYHMGVVRQNVEFNLDLSGTNVRKIGEIDLTSWYDAGFNRTNIKNFQKCEYCVLKGFGDERNTTGWQGQIYSWTPGDGTYPWGSGSEENRKSLVDSILTYSVDRSSNPMDLYSGVLPKVIYDRFTDEEKAALRAKGYYWSPDNA